MSLFSAPDPDTAHAETLPERIRINAIENPNSTALICDNKKISWKEIDGRVSRVANALLTSGLNHGDNVAILAENSPEYFETFFGILRAGGCSVPLSTMAGEEALQKMIIDADCKFFFLSEKMRNLVQSIEDQITCLLSNGKVAFDFRDKEWTNYGGWLSSASPTNPGIKISPTDNFNIIYSSGTTGVPKGILHKHAVRTYTAKAFAKMQFSSNSVTILSTPLYSNTTIAPLMPTVMMGATTVLMRRYNTEEFLSLVETERCTHTMLVPVQYQRIMSYANLNGYDLSTMTVKLSTSAPLRESLKKDILDRFPGLLIDIYGLTEGGGATTLICNEHPTKLNTVGKPSLGTSLKIINKTGIEVKQGVTGEIVARSPNMMAGYFRRDNLTEEILWHDSEGLAYFRSGDAGWIDEEGFLHLSDRLKDMIISGGFNIYANDIEVELTKHRDVHDVAVIGIPHEEWGETPLALIVPSSGSQTTEESLKKWVNRRLGKTQYVSQVKFVSELPRSSIGKILKKELRAPYWARER